MRDEGAEGEGVGVGGSGSLHMLANNTRNRSQQKVARARKLRKEMSISEKVLWRHLRKDRIGFSFRKQVPILGFCLDFYCPEAKLCVEVDGEQHKDSLEFDARRDKELAKAGILTIRIPSLDLFDPSPMLAQWLREIQRVCGERTSRGGRKDTPEPPTPTPSPSTPSSRKGQGLRS